MVPVLLGISAIVFFLVRLSGDPVSLMLGEDALPQQVEELRRSLGLDRPLLEQYLRFLAGALRGDMGTSLRYAGQPALSVVLERLPATLQLAGASLAVAVLMSLGAALVGALRPNGVLDVLARSLAVLGQAMPNYWLGIMLTLLFSVSLRWLPVSGYGTPSHLVLPALTLGTGLAAMLLQLLRGRLLEVLSLDYVRTAVAKGLPPRTVLLKHAMRNALISYLTVVGLQMANLVAGAVITEQVFAWPGIGLLTVQAINFRDMNVVQCIVLVSAALVMLANLAVDLLYALVDPRIRYG